jgi:hypothetical protein
MNGPQSNFGQPGSHPHPAHPQQHPGMHPANPTAHPTIRPMPVTPINPPSVRSIKHGEEPLSLVADESNPAEPVKSKIRAFAIAEANIGAHAWKRSPHASPTGACRVRSFHGRLSDQGMDYLDNAINEWLDQHPEVEVKFVTSTVGMFDGKIKDFALVLNIWY